MTDDNSDKLVDIASTDDQDEFEAAFFGTPQDDEAEEVVENEDEDGDEDDHLATEDDSEAPEDSEDEDEDEELEEEPKPKPKSKTQIRIEKLVAEARIAERERDAALQELQQLRVSKEKVEHKEEKLEGVRDDLSEAAPKPDAKDKDGEPLYPLGEYDPLFIQDLTRFTMKQEIEATEKQREQEYRQQVFEAAQKEIQNTWIENLERVEQEIPDIRESIRDLTDTFGNLDPAYGDYLASSIMASEFGPEIMYYFSQNIGEAQKIVASGPAAATRAIGRLEAKFEKPVEQRQQKKVSEAPDPPSGRTRGQGGRFVTPDDTDDQEAFEREFFKKR
jgi:hypothetical protein